MKLHLSATKVVLALALTALIIGFSAFSQKDKLAPYSFRKEAGRPTDDTTTPNKRDRYLTGKDLDKIDEAMKKLDFEMEKLDERMSKMDFSKIEKEVDAAMNKVDFNKIERQIDESLKKIDLDKINRDIKGSLAHVEKVDMARVKANVARAKIQFEKERINFKTDKIKANVEKAVMHAKESMIKAKEELQNMKAFTNELQKDGLINKSKDYKIEVKSGELYINDEKQTKEISDKYRKYYRKENFTINMNENEGVRV
jgi:citrate lyase gamma subunit